MELRELLRLARLEGDLHILRRDGVRRSPPAENLAFRLLQEFLQEVGFAHGAQLESVEPYSLNQAMQSHMRDFPKRFEDRIQDPEKFSFHAKLAPKKATVEPTGNQSEA